MLKVILKTTLVACLLPVGAAASTHGLKNPVVRVAPGTYEVVNKWHQRSYYLWCSAAKAARDDGYGGQSRLYVERADGQSVSDPRYRGVTFGVQSTARETSGGFSSTSVATVGNSMSVGAALGRCLRELDLY